MRAHPSLNLPPLVSLLASGLLLATPSPSYAVDVQLTKGGLLI